MNVQEEITFKKLVEEDITLLTMWFANPHVNEWWPILEKNEVIERFLKRIRSKDTFGYIIYLDSNPIGYIQYYYVNHDNEKTGKGLPTLPENTVGIDQFIGDSAYIGKGIGTRMIHAFISYLAAIEPHITTIIVDPDPANERAIRCYEKVGFKKVDIYELSYGSAMLMQYDI